MTSFINPVWVIVRTLLHLRTPQPLTLAPKMEKSLFPEMEKKTPGEKLLSCQLPG
jgi:hypothetical protein